MCALGLFGFDEPPEGRLLAEERELLPDERLPPEDRLLPTEERELPPDDRRLPAEGEKAILADLASGGAPVEVTGARDDPEDALANLLTALETLGLITDSTTAT